MLPIFPFVVYNIYTMAFIRRIRKGKSTYLALVESYRAEGKVRQKVLKYLGKDFGEGIPQKKVYPHEIEIENVKRYADAIAVEKLANELHLKKHLGNYYKEIMLLVYSHLLENQMPVSQVSEWVKNTYLDNILSIQNLSAKRIYKSLEYLSQIDFTQIESHISEKLKDKCDSDDAVILDVTDTYFADKQCAFSEKARRGKDGKYEKLVQISLAINRASGFPLFHKIYEGNISNVHILKDMVCTLKAKGIENCIITDRGASSTENVSFLNQFQLKTIIGLKRTKKLEQIVNSIPREQIYSLSNRITLQNTNLYALEFEYLGQRVIVVYNPVLEVTKRENAYSRRRNTGKEKYLGYSFIYTNTDFDKAEVVRLYFEKEIIERSFRQLKGILSLHPIRVWLKSHVIAHIRICYLAYCLLSLLAYYIKDLPISAQKALAELKNSYVVNLKTATGDLLPQKIFLKNIHKSIFAKIGVVYKN